MDAARERDVHFTLLQADDRLVHRGQRRRARHLQRYRRPFEAQRVGDSSRGDTRVGAQVAARPAGGCEQFPVLAPRRAGIHPRPAASQPVRVHARVLQGQPTRLQHHPLRRVHHPRLDGRDTEEPGVELVEVLDESSVPEGCFLGSRVSEGPVPRTGARASVRHRALARFQLTPEG